MQNQVAIDMRERIIEAAITIAARSGFTQATTKEIAGEAGCSEGIIYHYFSTKNELFRVVIKESAEEFFARLKNAVGAEGNAWERLEKLIDFHFHYFTGKVNIFQILFGKAGDTLIPFSFMLKTLILPYLAIIESIIMQGIHSEEFVPINAEGIATSLLGMMQLNIIKLHFGLKDNSVAEIKKTVKLVIFKAIMRKS